MFYVKKSLQFVKTLRFLNGEECIILTVLNWTDIIGILTDNI